MHYLPRKLRLTKEQWVFNSSFLLRIISDQVDEENSERSTLGGRYYDLEMLKAHDAMSVKIKLNKCHRKRESRNRTKCRE